MGAIIPGKMGLFTIGIMTTSAGASPDFDPLLFLDFLSLIAIFFPYRLANVDHKTAWIF